MRMLATRKSFTNYQFGPVQAVLAVNRIRLARVAFPILRKVKRFRSRCVASLGRCACLAVSDILRDP
jgi:hypothetical protein